MFLDSDEFSLGDVVREVSVSGVVDTYAYDGLNRQVSHTDGRGYTSHTQYNALGLRSASIDALGNRTAYAYDRYGNLATVTNPLGNAVVYEYDLRGRKTYEGGATYPVRYTYDVFGNKTTMTTYRNESLGPSSGDLTTWRYDEASNCMTNKVYADGKGPKYYLCIQRLDAANGNAVDLAFVWDATEPIATHPLVLQTEDVLSYYTHDGNKNISNCISNDGFALVEHYEYSPFGQRMMGSSSNPFGFSSECHDDCLGLVYYTYRNYLPIQGRWASRDPATEFYGRYGYVFVHNSPLIQFDRLGLISVPDWIRNIYLWTRKRQAEKLCVEAGGVNTFNGCCCEGKPFSPGSECCREGAVYDRSKALVVAAIKYKMRTGAPKGGFDLYEAHYWLDWGKSERVEANVSGAGKGLVTYHRIRDDSVNYRLGGYDYSLPEPSKVVISKCDYNVAEFHRCLTERAEQDTGTYTNKLCHEYVDGIVGDCLEKQRRKERR